MSVEFSSERKMTDESNIHALETIKEILPHFYYTNHCIKEISNHLDRCIQGDYGHEECNWLKNLPWNNQGRLLWEIEPNQDQDLAYTKFKRTIEIKIYNGIPEDKLNVVEEILADYDLFLEGRTKDGQKLFKWLLKNNLFTQAEIEEVTTTKQNNSVYAVLSKNPVDFLFCSTDQSFSSCLSLDSSHDGAYYMGLPAAFMDKSRYAFFIMRGKSREYPLKGVPVRHFRMLSRCWCFVTEDNELVFSKVYPYSMFDLSTIKEALNYSVYKDDELEWRSMSPAYFAEDIKGSEVSIYYDVSIDHEGHFESGVADGAAKDYDWYDGFNNCESYEELTGDSHRVFCEYCENRCNSDTTIYIDNYGYVCENCLVDNFTCCQSCHSYVPDDDVFGDVKGLGIICRDCADYHGCKECESCGELLNNDEICTSNHGEIYCGDCYNERYSSCEKCGEEIDISEEFCDDCKEEMEDEE